MKRPRATRRKSQKKPGLSRVLAKRFARAKSSKRGRISTTKRSKTRAWRLRTRTTVVREVVTPAPQPAPPPQPSQPYAQAPYFLTIEQLLIPTGEIKNSLEGFLLDQRSEHTRIAYSKDLKRFGMFLAVRKEAKPGSYVDRHAIISYKEWLLNEKLEHTTVDRHLATLRGLFHWLVEDGHVEKNPASSVRLMNPKRLSKTLGFSDEEVRRVLGQPNLHTRAGAQHYAILMILFYGGLRRSEICALKNANINRERGQVVLRLQGKGNRERLIPLLEPVWHALKYYFLICNRTPAHQPQQPLFAPRKNNRTGVMLKHLDPSSIYYIVVKYAKLAGIIHKVSPHSCRATAISNARDHKVSDRAIQEFAGWSSTDMITRYDKRRTSIENSAAHAIAYGAEGNLLPLQAIEIPLAAQTEAADSS